jgi:MbtH protein
MTQDDAEDTEIYKVVVNDEGQYSIWRVDMPNPLGWYDADKVGSKAECLAHIDKVWTDMTPRSVAAALAANDSDYDK